MPRYEAKYERVETVSFVFPHEDSDLLSSSENLAAAHAEALGRVMVQNLGPAAIRDRGEWRQCGWTKIPEENP